MTLKRPKNDQKMTQRLIQKWSKMTQKWPKNDPKMTPKWSPVSLSPCPPFKSIDNNRSIVNRIGSAHFWFRELVLDCLSFLRLRLRLPLALPPDPEARLMIIDARWWRLNRPLVFSIGPAESNRQQNEAGRDEGIRNETGIERREDGQGQS